MSRPFANLFACLLVLGLLAPTASAHEGPDPYGEWRSFGAAHFRTGEMQNIRVDESSDALVLDQSVPGVYLPAGVFTSPFFKAELPFDLLQIGYGVDLPDHAEIEVQVRALGGDTVSKTRWYTLEREGELELPSEFRYLQYRVRMYTTNPEASPVFEFFHADFGHRSTLETHLSPLGTGNGDVPRPEIVSRVDWGAFPPKGSYSSHSPNHMVVHHSSLPTQGQYQGKATIRGIQRYHQEKRGWIDIGYHFLIGPEGVIYQGRPETVSGAHVIPNHGKVGICVIGNYQGEDELTPQTREALIKLLAWLGSTYGIDPGTHLQGHRDWMSTDCPGDQLYQQLPEIRVAVREAMDVGGEGDPTP